MLAALWRELLRPKSRKADGRRCGGWSSLLARLPIHGLSNAGWRHDYARLRALWLLLLLLLHLVPKAAVCLGTGACPGVAAGGWRGDLWWAV